MKPLLYIIAFYAGFALIGWLFTQISNAFQKHRENIRDHVAKDVLNGLSIEAVIESYINKLAQIKYTDFNTIWREINGLNIEPFKFIPECPKCNEGYFVIRKGKHGEFIGCTKYPVCDYADNIKKSRADNKISINEKILDDIRRAYS
jgi:hypothetical protein